MLTAARMRIQNTYGDGYCTDDTRVIHLNSPCPREDFLEWIDDVLFTLTGTGRVDDYAVYEVDVVCAPVELPGLAGYRFEAGY
ncbi:hypothetical protein ACWZHB_01295 [Nocardia sp. FBN12]|uniref:hypothetical protein n=1 Tax=Nocardia sp. FBN12 TaxID=3419766 RepID=UPI003CFE36F7